MDTPLEITTDGTNIVISPSKPGDEASFVASVERINDRFGSTLERLGK